MNDKSLLLGPRSFCLRGPPCSTLRGPPVLFFLFSPFVTFSECSLEDPLVLSLQNLISRVNYDFSLNMRRGLRFERRRWHRRGSPALQRTTASTNLPWHLKTTLFTGIHILHHKADTFDCAKPIVVRKSLEPRTPSLAMFVHPARYNQRFFDSKTNIIPMHVQTHQITEDRIDEISASSAHKKSALGKCTHKSLQRDPIKLPYKVG